MTFPQLIAALRQSLIDALIFAAILALLVAIVVEFFKAFFRTFYCRMIIKNWWDALKPDRHLLDASRDFDSGKLEPSATWKELKAGEPLEPIMKDASLAAGSQEQKPQDPSFLSEALNAGNLPRQFMMKKIENLARSVLERPAEQAKAFFRLTHGASPADRILVFQMDKVARTDPARLGKLRTKTGDSEDYLPMVLTAQAHVPAAVERNLDDLQLTLTRSWPGAVRIFATAVGILLAFLLAYSFIGLDDVRSQVMLFLIGAGAGFLATIIYDFVGIISRVRDRQM